MSLRRHGRLQRPHPALHGNRRIALGHRGEDWAAEWYVDNGYEIVARNWRCANGEIDLLCTQVNPPGCVTLIVCEVKARTSA